MEKNELPHKNRITWPDNSVFFTTSSTFLHYPFFREFNQKMIVLDKIKQVGNIEGMEVIAYSIAMNHFHLLTHVRKGLAITKMKTLLHSGISREYRKAFNVPYPDFWQNSRTLWIKDEKAYWSVLGYTAGNLLKHKEVGSFKELLESPFSSFSILSQEHGLETSREIVTAVIAVEESAEGAIDIEEISACEIPRMR